MSEYIYGAATMLMFTTAVNIIDKNIPNSLWYYFRLYMPF